VGKSQNPRLILYFTVPLVLLVALAAALGLFEPGTYAREVPFLAVQGVGQDAVNLFLLVPLLLVSSVLALRGSRLFFQVWGGSMFYAAYSFVIYAFGLHFNPLFLAYCAALGFSVYGFVYYLSFSSARAGGWYDDRAPVRPTAVFLVVIAALFYLVWLKEIVPALLRGATPRSIVENGMPVNPVFVLDLSLVLPALGLAAAALWKKRSLGFALAPAALVLCVLMAVAIAGMVLALRLKRLTFDPGLMAVFAVLALVSLGFLASLFRHLRKPGPDR
jgi:hypothetical protein